MSPLIIALVQQVLLPEILVAIRAHRNATGQDPTADQVFAALNLDADRVVAVGQAWLDAHES